jgi:predicted LPLAT superfamily acyltransferase
VANTTFGSQWMHRQLINALRWIDVRWFYVFTTLFVVPICLLFNTNHSRTTAYRYFRERHGYGRWKSAWATFVNHCLFSQVVVDRFAIFAGKHFDLNIVGYDNFLRLAAQDDGFMMFSSHVGCYEVAGCSLVSETKRFNALVYGGEKETVMEGRKKKLDSNNITMIPILPDMSHLFKINEALANNEIVSMPADRSIGSSKTLTVQLLGAPASLPMGPFSVATMRSLDVIAVNVMKTSSKGYTAYVTPLAYDKQAPRREQMIQLAQSYARELETCIRQYPTQWYNYYDFWQKTTT